MNLAEAHQAAFSAWFEKQYFAHDYRDLCLRCWLEGAAEEEKRWVQKAVAAFSAGGKDAVQPGLEG